MKFCGPGGLGFGFECPHAGPATFTSFVILNFVDLKDGPTRNLLLLLFAIEGDRKRYGGKPRPASVVHGTSLPSI